MKQIFTTPISVNKALENWEVNMKDRLTEQDWVPREHNKATFSSLKTIHLCLIRYKVETEWAGEKETETETEKSKPLS